MTDLIKLQETIRKGFIEVDKEFEEFNIKVANKALNMLKEVEQLVDNCDPKSINRISATNVYIQKHADNLLEKHNNLSSMVSMLEKKFENECVCNKK